MRDFKSFPGEELIRKGLQDLAANRDSVEALLVSIGAPRLRFNGMHIDRILPDPEHQLYLRLAREFGDDAHSRYNALIRRLVSFEQALECAK